MKHILSFVLPGAIILGALVFMVPSPNWNTMVTTPQSAQVATGDLVTLTLIGDADTITQTSVRINATPQWWKFETNTEKKFSQFEVDFPNGSTKTYAYGYYSDTFYHMVTGLTCNTKYPYRAATLNTIGPPYYSGTKYFTTLPCSANNPAPQITLSANPNPVESGKNATISLLTKNATKCSSSDIGAREIGIRGDFEVGPITKNTTYEVVCQNIVGDFVTESILITTVSAVTIRPQIVSFAASPASVQSGNTTTLTWESKNTSQCGIQGLLQKPLYSPTGSVQTQPLLQPQTFVLRCANEKGIETEATLLVPVYSNPITISVTPVINTFTVTPANPVFAGNPATISWSTVYANSCQLDSEAVSVNGSRTVNLYSSRQYVLVCAGGDGQVVSKNIFIQVDSNNGGGSNQLPVIGNLSVSPLTVLQGEYATIYWNSDADYCTATGAWSGQKNSSGSEQVGPVYDNQTYTLTCYKNGRSTTQSVMAFVQTTTITTQNTSALTSVPTRVRAQNADLNGIALIGNGSITQGWFEWGNTRDLGNRTNTQSLGTNRTVDFTDTVSGLLPNTQYFYRAVVQNNNVVYRGDIVSFSTERIVTTTQTTFVRQPVNTVRPITQARVIATQARAVTPNPNTNTTLQSQTYGRPVFIELTTTQVSPQVAPNANVEYRVQYRNITSTLLTNTAIKVVLPEEFEYVSATRGIYSSENKTLTLFLGDIQPREENAFTIIGRVVPTAQIGKTVVVTGYANYTILKTNQFTEYQDEVIAYALSLIQAGGARNVNQAAGVGATDNTFWRTDIGRAFAWLLLILILLVILYLIRKIYKTFKGE